MDDHPFDDIFPDEYLVKTPELALNAYQQFTGRTAVYKDSVHPQHVLEYLVLGLVGEAGELANRAKKVLRNQSGDEDEGSKAKLTGELGDVLWYVAQLAEYFGSDLESVALSNLKKLSGRMARGTIGGSGEDR